MPADSARLKFMNTTKATRMTLAQVLELAREGAEEHVLDVYNDQGVEALIRCQAPGHVRWDEGAYIAGAAAVLGVPKRLRADYYREYADAADRLAAKLIADAESR